MKALEMINRSCYGMCVLAVVAGAFLSIWSIWTDQEDVLGKGLATVATLVFSGIVIVVLNSTLGARLLGGLPRRTDELVLAGGPSTVPPATPGEGATRRQALDRLTSCDTGDRGESSATG